MILLFRRFLAYILVPLFLLLLIGSVAITCAGMDDDLHSADLAVVLGNKVEPDGQPSPALQARLDHTVDLYRQGYFKLVLVSGAHGKEGYNEPSVMRRYLEANGVPHGAVLEDNNGSNTWKTAQNSARILNELHLKSVLIISQYFHLPRCRLAFVKFGIQPIYASPAHYWSIRDLYSVPREVVAYVVYSLRTAKISQDFTGGSPTGMLTLTSAVNPDLSVSNRPEDYINMPDHIGYDAWKSFNAKRGEWVIFISEFDKNRGSYYSNRLLEPPTRKVFV